MNKQKLYELEDRLQNYKLNDDRLYLEGYPSYSLFGLNHPTIQIQVQDNLSIEVYNEATNEYLYFDDLDKAIEKGKQLVIEILKDKLKEL